MSGQATQTNACWPQWPSVFAHFCSDNYPLNSHRDTLQCIAASPNLMICAAVSLYSLIVCEAFGGHLQVAVRYNTIPYDTNYFMSEALLYIYIKNEVVCLTFMENFMATDVNSFLCQ